MKPGNVEWKFSGSLDSVAGSGATTLEKGLVYATSAIAAFVYVGLWYFQYYDWRWWQYAICAFFAFDIAGGVIANTTNSGKRFYHTKSNPSAPRCVRLLTSRMNFALLHMHPIWLAAVVPGGHVMTGVLWYLALVGGVLIVNRVPLYLQRPVAFLGIMLAIALHTCLLPLGVGLEWVIPLLFIKILYGHAVQEEPYRPVTTHVRPHST